MKIAMVSPYDFAWPGGVNVHVAQLSSELRYRGHSVCIIAPQTPARPLTAGLAEEHFIPMGRTVPLSAGGSQARVALSWRLYSRVRRLMAREQFDIVHLHEPLAPLLPLMVLHHSNSVNIGTFHAYSDRQRLYRLSRPALRRWHQRLHGHIAVSAAARAFVAPHFPQCAYQLIPNGIEYPRFAGAKPFPHLRDGKKNILFVGRKDERKGLRYLLKAFIVLRHQREDLRLVIAGPGDLDRESADSLDEIVRIDDRAVLNAGAVTNDALPRYYASADVFCSPATGGESFGIVLLEAMAAGAPVVASDIHGYRDVVAHGETGLLVPARAPHAIAGAISRLLDNPSLALRLSEKGRRVAQQYRWQRVASEVEAYYQRCAEEAKRVGFAR